MTNAIEVADVHKVYRGKWRVGPCAEGNFISSSTGSNLRSSWTVFWQVDLLRFSLLGVGSATSLLLEAAATLIFALICLGVAVRALNRAD